MPASIRFIIPASLLLLGIWMLSATSVSAACTNGSTDDCNPVGSTLNAAAAFVDPTPPASYVQCAGFINTPQNDVDWNWENNCIPFKDKPFFLRVIDDASGQILAGARLHSATALTPSWSATGLNYRTDQTEGEGLLDNPNNSSSIPGTSLAWHELNRSFCGCGRPGGGSGTCNDIFTANAANNKILYVGGNSTNHNYEAVYGPPGGKNTCSLFNENVRIRLAIYAFQDVLQVDIDIKPGSDENPINTKSKGVIPVAILGSADFDVARVDMGTLLFNGSAAPAHDSSHLDDVNGDGFADLVSHYPTEDSGLAAGDTEACVTGQTVDGRKLNGCDSVRVK